MTDNEIIKALEICGVDLDCKHCSFQGGQCVNKLINESLSLINRQKAELDDLKRDDLPRCKDALRRANEIGIDLEKENKELRAEIEKLALHNAILLESCAGYSRSCDTYRAEIERLNEYISRCKSGEEYWVKCLLERPNEAIKEFAERLKKVYDGYTILGRGVAKGEIDILVKEMVGDPDD